MQREEAYLIADMVVRNGTQGRSDDKAAPPKQTRPWPYDGPEGRARLTGSLETDQHAVEWDDPKEQP